MHATASLRRVNISIPELKLKVSPGLSSLSTLETTEGGPALQILSQFWACGRKKQPEFL